MDIIFWIKTGFTHILDFNGYDHMLFLWMTFLTLDLKEIKSILIKITAFTIAHSVTLALSAMDILRINSSLIEILIAVSILLASIISLVKPQKQIHFQTKIDLALIGFFGLIHGVGFSGLLTSLLGKGTAVIQPLFAFNIGLEIGQIIFIIPLILLQTWMSQNTTTWKPKYIQIASIAGAVISLMLIVSRL